MSSPSKPILHAQPVVDEWGIYDPDQAGVAALLTRLDAQRATPPYANDPRGNVSAMRDVKQPAGDRR